MLTSLATGLAGLVSLGYLKTVTPRQGTGLELEAIAAAVIGGPSMAGGVGSIVGTFIGTFIMAEVRTGLILLGTDAYIQDAFVGLVIALAVIVILSSHIAGKGKARYYYITTLSGLINLYVSCRSKEHGPVLWLRRPDAVLSSAPENSKRVPRAGIGGVADTRVLQAIFRIQSSRMPVVRGSAD